MPRLDTLRIIGSGGANRAMEAEVKRLVRRALPGFILPKPERVDTQTLLFPFDPALAWFAVSYLRTPSRVLWDLFETESSRLEPLYDELRDFIELDRPSWLTNGSTISVRVPDATGFPASGLQIRGTIKNAIIDGARAHDLEVSLDAEDAHAQLVARAVKGTDRFVLSLDLAGQAMHERGYRLEEGEAPLKENLAAQLLILARWDTRTEILLDPLAGAGTIPIEAALMGLAAPLWVAPKRPAALRLPPFEDKVLEKLPDLFADAKPVILANEIHTPLVEVMRRNLGRGRGRGRMGAVRDTCRGAARERGSVMV
jgi:23S rRNA G2445 N2-methylase RlmL